MLACELDLPISIDVGLTVLSSILAVVFTFIALGSDLLARIRWDCRLRRPRKIRNARNRHKLDRPSEANGGPEREPVSADLEEINSNDDGGDEEINEGVGLLHDDADRQAKMKLHDPKSNGPLATVALEESQISSDSSASRRSSFASSANSSHGLANIVNIAQRRAMPAKNAFKATAEALYDGFTVVNMIKGFLWSLAITGMHYVGIAALRVPQGYYTLNVYLVVLSAIISWIVCLVGVIMMSCMETHLAQQLLFSVVASVGVAAMHFTGM